MAKAALSGVILFALCAMAVESLPDSAIRRAAMPIAQPFLDLTGLHQNWNLFAPDPRVATLRLEARIAYASGTTISWHPPEGDPFIGVYGTFRWRKWAGNILSSRNKHLWRPTAEWIARTHVRDGELPLRVALVKQWYFAPPPGSGRPSVQPFKEEVLFTGRYEQAEEQS